MKILMSFAAHIYKRKETTILDLKSQWNALKIVHKPAETIPDEIGRDCPCAVACPPNRPSQTVRVLFAFPP